MSRRVFVTCLNTEAKIYNLPVLALILAAVLFMLVALIKGIGFGMGAGAFGFGLGGYVSKQWYLGLIQRWCYWHLPWQKLFVEKSIPSSHHRKLM